MKNLKVMKTVFLAMFLTMAPLSVLAAKDDKGGSASGGGDDCERKIKVVRDDLKKWIENGGAQYLKLPDDITLEQYNKKMKEQIKVAAMECVGPGDKGYPVTVGKNKTSKTCRWDSNPSRFRCEIKKFNEMGSSEQYNLIHHEYASLAGLEKPNDDDSNYEISDQISGFLSYMMVARLVVRPQVPNGEAYVTLTPTSIGEYHKLVLIDYNRKKEEWAGWEVVRILDDTFLNYSRFYIGENRGVVCYVKTPHRIYLGVSDDENEFKKALQAILVDDKVAKEAEGSPVICQTPAYFKSKYGAIFPLHKLFERLRK